MQFNANAIVSVSSSGSRKALFLCRYMSGCGEESQLSLARGSVGLDRQDREPPILHVSSHIWVVIGLFKSISDETRELLAAW
jgi:hypothetical protein